MCCWVSGWSMKGPGFAATSLGFRIHIDTVGLGTCWVGLWYVGIVLNYCQYGVLCLGSYFNTGPYINFPHFGNSNLGKLSCL